MKIAMADAFFGMLLGFLMIEFLIVNSGAGDYCACPEFDLTFTIVNGKKFISTLYKLLL